jgi:hypothetical protein
MDEEIGQRLEKYYDMIETRLPRIDKPEDAKPDVSPSVDIFKVLAKLQDYMSSKDVDLFVESDDPTDPEDSYSVTRSNTDMSSNCMYVVELGFRSKHRLSKYHNIRLFTLNKRNDNEKPIMELQIETKKDGKRKYIANMHVVLTCVEPRISFEVQDPDEDFQTEPGRISFNVHYMNYDVL